MIQIKIWLYPSDATMDLSNLQIQTATHNSLLPQCSNLSIIAKDTSRLNVTVRILLCLLQPQAALAGCQHNCTDIDVNCSYW